MPGVSFDLFEGETLRLVWVNGSGKTSLLRAVDSGLPVGGGRIRARSEPELLGVGAALDPQLSGRRNAYLGGTDPGVLRGDVEDRFEEIIEYAGVDEFIDMPLRTFSSGMNARLRFAIAAAVEPDVLLIDEAFAVGGRFKRKSDLRMRALIAKGGALVLVSHGLASIEDMCSRVIWLHHGQVRLDGPAEEVLDAYRKHTSR